jgi:RNA polymerase sigma factor (sigma-70 family)
VDDPTSQLRARARAGDAFGAVFDACAKSVYNRAFRLTGDWSAAEEVMSMTFLEAWRCRGAIAADGGSLRPWLLGIATNLARGQRRAAWRHRTALARLARLAVADELPDFADDAPGRLDDAARIKALRRALAGLPRPEFEVLALCAVCWRPSRPGRRWRQRLSTPPRSWPNRDFPPGPGQWIYYKTVDYSASSSGQPGGVSTDREWITFDGSGSAYDANGQHPHVHREPARSRGECVGGMERHLDAEDCPPPSARTSRP